jgi:hypothetical protein
MKAAKELGISEKHEDGALFQLMVSVSGFSFSFGRVIVIAYKDHKPAQTQSSARKQNSNCSKLNPSGKPKRNHTCTGSKERSNATRRQ